MKTIILTFILVTSLTISFSQQYWQEVQSGTNLKLNSISFGSEMVGYIGADDSTILKTTDGGINWFPLQHSGIDFSNGNNGSTNDIIHIEFVNENEGYLTINNSDTLFYYFGKIFKTIDGGVNWIAENTGMCSPVKTFHFDTSSGYTIGASCFGGKTIDKKQNGVWNGNPQYLTWNIDYLRAIDFYDTTYGIVGGDSGTIYRTFDAGINWDTVNIGANFSPIGGVVNDIEFINDSTVVLVSNLQNELFKISTDSGKIWNDLVVNTFLGPRMKSLTYSAKDFIISVGTATGIGYNIGVIYSYNRSSNSFGRQVFSKGSLNSINMANDSIAFAIGDSGLIVSNKFFLTGINKVNHEKKIVIYPNPTNGVVNIESEGMKFIEILDMNGRIIKDNNITNLTIQVLDLKSIKKGVYLVKIYFENNHTQIKKIVVN